MGSKTGYKLSFTDRITSHAWLSAFILRDQNDDEQLEIDAAVASGDCFVMLATSLDASTEHLEGSPALPQVEKVIKTLLHLQRHYQIVRKRSEYRQ